MTGGFLKLSNIELRTVSGKGILIYVVFEGSIMPELQPLSSIFPLAQIKRPPCPKCQGRRMLLVRIGPAFLGTDLHTLPTCIRLSALRAITSSGRLARATTGRRSLDR